MRPEILNSYIPDPYHTAKFVIKKNISTPKLRLKIEFRIDTFDSISVPISFNATIEEMKLGLLSMKTLNDVTVTKALNTQATVPPLSRHGCTWNVTFSTFAGDAPSLLVSTDDGLTFLTSASGGSNSESTGLTGSQSVVSVAELTKGIIPTSHVVNALQSTKTYYARVRAHNKIGVSAWTISKFSAIPQKRAPTAARNVAATIISKTAIGISWEMPSYEGGDSVSFVLEDYHLCPILGDHQ